ncbi:GNAT family N-acetyltransferase [Geodermatophilus sp. SYSU D01119]
MLTAYHLTTEREKGCPVRATAELDRLRVEPAQRGRGLGEPALRDAVRRCADAGTGTLRLSAWEWRSAAIPLHRRTGSTDCPPWDPRPGHVCLGRRTG